MSKRGYSKEFKHKVLLAYENRYYSVTELCQKFEISKRILREWIARYEKYGTEGLEESSTWQYYSKELKETAVREYISGAYSQNEIVPRYEISSLSVLQRWIDEAGMTQSMSRVDRCIDNGPMESFWGTLKCEKYYLHKYETFEELLAAIDEYIYFYNHERYQERLSGLSPMEYRAKAA